jgi:hypothetical protein
MVALLLLLAKERADQGGSSRPKQQEQRAHLGTAGRAVATTHASSGSSTIASGSSQATLGASSKSATASRQGSSGSKQAQPANSTHARKQATSTAKQGRAVAHGMEQLSVQRMAIPSKQQA